MSGTHQLVKILMSFWQTEHNRQVSMSSKQLMIDLYLLSGPCGVLELAMTEIIFEGSCVHRNDYNKSRVY